MNPNLRFNPRFGFETEATERVKNMQSTTEITLNDGRTNRCDVDFEPVVNGSWHPSEYAIADAEQLAADLIGGLDEDGNSLKQPSDLAIRAVTNFVPGEKWSCSFSGKLMQSGKQIGTFTASTSYQFD